MRVPSTALQCFSESVLEYLANLDKAPDPTVRRDTFSSEVFSAYEVLFNVWLPSRETKVWLRRRRDSGGRAGLKLSASGEGRRLPVPGLRVPGTSFPGF